MQVWHFLQAIGPGIFGNGRDARCDDGTGGNWRRGLELCSPASELRWARFKGMMGQSRMNYGQVRTYIYISNKLFLLRAVVGQGQPSSLHQCSRCETRRPPPEACLLLGPVFVENVNIVD
jgi:hypothetical protein